MPFPLFLVTGPGNLKLALASLLFFRLPLCGGGQWATTRKCGAGSVSRVGGDAFLRRLEALNPYSHICCCMDIIMVPLCCNLTMCVVVVLDRCALQRRFDVRRRCPSHCVSCTHLDQLSSQPNKVCSCCHDGTAAPMTVRRLAASLRNIFATSW